MTTYYVNQKFSLKDQFSILDANQEEVFTAEAESLVALTKKIMLRTMAGEELLLIDEKFNWFLPRFEFYIGDERICEMKSEFAWFKKKYNIVTPAWQIEGDIWDHQYEIKEGNETIATIRKEFFSWMDAYEINVFYEDYTELILGIVIAIDADLSDDGNN